MSSNIRGLVVRLKPLEKLDPLEFCVLGSDQVISDVYRLSGKGKTEGYQEYSFKGRFQLQSNELCFSEMSGKFIFLPYRPSTSG